MKPDGKCILNGVGVECDCDNCFNCKHYKDKELLEDLMLEQKEQM